ncbi:hypothetical protein F2Q70_00034008 [Brassica cretica]|uniref:Ubiquitin-like protease family profile domain-containing protein n=1 Tax=Brassica cretica TaxID=69181 RepID=A0A8S9JVZ8_BRACR|nr:hypothetical protein F2Q70_00034008 [Brassica cretica]
MSDLLKCQSCDHSYLHEEWKARQGNTTIDLSRASNMQLLSLELPQQENSFDCGLFLLHYLELFVAQAPAKFNPSLITRSGNFLTRKWFPAKEASLKRGYILELLYNLHKGHDPSILPADSKSKPPHCRVSNENDEENESKNVTEICKWRKPFDGSSAIVTYIPQTETCSADQILSKEVFYTRGYDLPEASKRRKSFMSPIVEVQESGEKEEIHLPMDTEESICQEMGTLRKEECMLYIEDTDDEDAVVEYVPDSQDSSSNGEEATSVTSVSREVDSENPQVLIIPDVIIYGEIYCTNSKLTFSRNCMTVESSSVNATKGTFSCQWAIEDIVRIESQWCSEVETAFVNVLLKSRDPIRVDNAKEISGIDLLKFSVYDAKWPKEVETIKLLDSRYKDIWFDTIT